MENEEVDQELIDLLQSISKREPLPVDTPVTKKVETKLEPQVQLEQELPKKQDIVSQKTLPVEILPVETLPLVEVESSLEKNVTLFEPELKTKPEKEQPLADLVEEEKEKDDVGVKKLLGKFNTSVEIIISNHAKDREQIETGIQLLETLVRDAVQNKTKISPSYVEAWAKLIQAKTEVNANATGVLDSIAKLLSAGKKNDLIINQTSIQNSSTLDLDALLSQPDN